MVNTILPKILFQTVPKKLGESICRYESVKLLGELDAMGGGSYRTFEAVDPATGKSYPIAVGPKGEDVYKRQALSLGIFWTVTSGWRTLSRTVIFLNRL